MKSMWTPLILVMVTLLVVLVATGCQATRAGYESAPYQVVRAEGRFEVRDYPTLLVAETSMAEGHRDGSDGSFMRLFRFITGRNEGQRKIAMTTPVFMSGGESNATMAFVLPAGLTKDDLPAPTDEAVTLRELPAGRFAVLRFRGGRSAKNEAESLARLRAWLAAKDLGALPSPIYGYFDPPWTPSFLRRNEVMLRVENPKPE